MDDAPAPTPTPTTTPADAPPEARRRRERPRPPRGREHRHAPHLHTPAGGWLLLVVFLAGASLMAYEIAGARVMAPFFGSSTFTWGAVIGVFLGALSGGYWIGGRVSDRHPTAGALTTVLSAAAVLVLASGFVAQDVQQWVVNVDFGARANPLVAAILLFAPASVLMGMVSPYAVRLRAQAVETMGSTAGALYGLSTFGSIVGTWGASFILIEELGVERTMLAVAGALAACCIIAALASGWRGISAIGASVATGIVLVAAATGGLGEVDATFQPAGSEFSPVFRAGGFEEEFTPSGPGDVRESADSAYHRIRVVDYERGVFADDSAVRVMHFDNSLQASTRIDASGEVVDASQPVFSYLTTFDLVPAIVPGAERVLFVGLGSGAAPMRLAELRPDLEIDVVEIDPVVVETAREWFGYVDDENGNDNVHTHVGDGRTWLAAQDTTWDAIVVDAYFADSIPSHLATVEFLTELREHLADDGVAVANIIGAVSGYRSELFRAMHTTWSHVFEDVAVYPVRPELDRFINIELIAGAAGAVPPRGGEATLVRALEQDAGLAEGAIWDEDLQEIVERRYVQEIPEAELLTDDDAPIDSLLQVGE